MTEREALITAVVSNRDDDTPRLVFADWCDDNGEPDRAAFVRCQVERNRHLSTGDPGCNCAGKSHDVNHVCRQTAWVNKAYELEKQERELYPFVSVSEAKLVNVKLDQWTWLRGFVEHLTLDWPTFRDHADTLTASHPIREVTLTTMPDEEWVLARTDQRGERPAYGFSDPTLRFLAAACLKREWKRIDFTLPPEIVASGWDTPPTNSTPLADLIEMARRMQEMGTPITGAELLDFLEQPNPTSSPRSGHEPTA